MTPATLAERKAALASVVDRAKAGLAELLVGFRPHSPEHSAIVNANVQLGTLLNIASTAADGLLPYTDPTFYDELPPSLALTDRGQHARDKLEQAFPE